MAKMQLQIKRAYDAPAESDGYRILVDRLWPRGIKKEALRLDAWLKDLAPSDALRHWFNHDPARWEEFREKYSAELVNHEALLAGIRQRSSQGPVTLVYAARSDQYNNARVLMDYLMQPQTRRRAETPPPASPA